MYQNLLINCACLSSIIVPLGAHTHTQRYTHIQVRDRYKRERDRRYIRSYYNSIICVVVLAFVSFLNSLSKKEKENKKKSGVNKQYKNKRSTWCVRNLSLFSARLSLLFLFLCFALCCMHYVSSQIVSVLWSLMVSTSRLLPHATLLNAFSVLHTFILSVCITPTHIQFAARSLLSRPTRALCFQPTRGLKVYMRVERAHV